MVALSKGFDEIQVRTSARRRIPEKQSVLEEIRYKNCHRRDRRTASSSSMITSHLHNRKVNENLNGSYNIESALKK